MASNHNSSRDHLTPQSIPLQDLPRPPDLHNGVEDSGRLGTITGGRSRAMSGNRQSFHGRVNTRYERVDEESPPRADESRLDVPHITTPRNALRPLSIYEDGELSPGTMGDFHTAMGSVGLSFDPAGPSRPPLVSTASAGDRTQLGMIAESDGLSPYTHSSDTINENDEYFSPQDNDRTPLNDERFLQPISGAQPSTPTGQRHDRHKSHSSRSSPGARLGDDLPNLEAGLRVPGSQSLHRMSSYSTRSLSRSLSTSGAVSPLSTAGTMLRKMSQRVVNLSNEPEIVEQEIRRQASTRQARLEAPPSFPAMTEYAHDGLSRSPSPLEKTPPKIGTGKPAGEWQRPSNPLKGKSLGTFAPDNRIRLLLCDFLVHPITEPVILILIVIQTLLLAIDAAPSLSYNSSQSTWSSSGIDYAMLSLFIIYTLEIIARIIVSGFARNAYEYSTTNQAVSSWKAFTEKCRNLFAPQRHQPALNVMNPPALQPSILRSFTAIQAQQDQPGHSSQQQRVRLARRAFLRHSFNRLDLLAVVSFWISFVLSNLGIEGHKHVFVFRMLSCLRILRLLSLTSGTSVILRSLKKAAPLLVNVAFLIGFFWLLFAIIGAQSFKASFRRTCVWYGDNVTEITPGVSTDISWNNYTQNTAPANIQFCGGYINATTGAQMPWLTSNFQRGTDSHKGFLCPRNSLCVEGGNPYQGTVSFDNVAQSLQLVFVIMSSNTFSDLLYYTTETDHLAAALFFAFSIVIMTLWLINLLVAVITSSFQVIREESKASAFTVDEQPHLLEEEEEPKKKRPLKRLYDKTYWLWIVVIIFSMVVQSLRTADLDQDPNRLQYINNSETVVTSILLVEILLRFITDWRCFHRAARNWVDLGLAIITSIMQIPQIRNSGQPYAWLSFFQILRFYRVVLAVPLTRSLILQVLGNATGLLNLIIFVFLLTFFVAIFAVQLFRGQIQPIDASNNYVRFTFTDIYNSFIGIYQVLSSENWTVLMYNATQYGLQSNTGWIGAIFFILWFILANFIILNMFIAVIQENFDVTEDEKRLQQVKAFLEQKELGGAPHGTLSLSAIFRLGRDAGRHRDPIEYGPATMEMLLKDTVVRDFLDEQMEPLDSEHENPSDTSDDPARVVRPGESSSVWGRLMAMFRSQEPNPFYSRLTFSRAREDLDPRTMAREVVSATEQKKRAQRQYLQNHPRYNVSLFIFKPSNPIRRFCQKIVGPGRGSQRHEGVDPVKPLWYTFSAFIYATIVVMVLLACITTPLYQRIYFLEHGNNVRNWFVWTDMGFAAVFTVEAIIKIIADGFFWTPNAYFRGSWGLIDGLVLVTLWINVITSLFKDGGVSRSVAAFKALRALRLLNVSDSARDTFHSVVVIGGWKVLSAAFVSLSLLIPFAIYGLNLFNGRFRMCNDTQSGIVNLTDCTGEYMSSPYNWNVLAPRQNNNPYYSFDNFGDALFILFQIVSQEGWVDVMWQAMGAPGHNKQFRPYASQGNAIFFIIFNLLGAVFVLTLFVSVYMRNYTEQTGVAFLTAEQRSWLELRKLLKQISPSKRPSNKSNEGWKNWCYRIAVKKHGPWQRFITAILVLHLILLVLEFYPPNRTWELVRAYTFLVFTLIYIVNIVIRIAGLTWKRFRRSSWDLYSLMSVGGTVAVTILNLSNTVDNPIYDQVNKLFLVSIALLLIPRNNQLDQLFKTAAASLTAIANLLATWFVLFLVYAIALTQTLGLTRFGSSENGNLNFRTVPKALILLFRMSMGEGWNQIMEDYAQASPPFCNANEDFFSSDCGSTPWARVLFISWNILSMYIFVSMFVSLIFESFSYVYQRSSDLSVINREETRRFKQAWATFDREGTGYISKETFPKLLAELSGVFEMRIYDSDHSVKGITEDCRAPEPRPGIEHPPGIVHGVDLAKLNKRISTINVKEIQRRRAKLDLFCQEILVSADPDLGIQFTQCLMILAHYNVISDSKSLKLEEFLRRRARLQRVEEDVRRRIVIGFFDTLYWSRIFRRRKELRHSARMVTVPQFAVPEIFVEDQDATTPRTDVFDPPSPGGTSPLYTPHSRTGSGSGFALGLGSSPPSPGGLRLRGDSVGSSPSRSEYSYGGNNASPTLRPRRPSHPFDEEDRAWYDGAGDDAASGGGGEGSRNGRSRGNSQTDRLDVRQVFEDSAWGESIRRSFTLRRNGTRGRGRD